jgi:hypothetical protein
MSRRREIAICAAAAAALVLLRSALPTLYEGYYFDSDQAIVGLMAKRAADFQEFPLFYSGLNYILAVEAWIIAPFFWIARPSVAILRVPLVAMNVAVAIWLAVAISRRLALRPALAFVAALPFIVPTPATGNTLLEAAGACIEPFVYVLLLWQLKRRPLALGAVLAVGYLHREFVVFAVPALLLAAAGYRQFATRRAAIFVARAAFAFALVYLVVDDLKMHLSGGSLALQAASLRGQMCVDGDWLSRVRELVTGAYPALLGGVPTNLQQIRMNTPLVTGYPAVGWLVAAALALMLARVVLARRQPPPQTPAPEPGFAAYLAWVGVLTAAAYPLSCNVTLGGAPILRYLLLGILLPVGVASLFFRRERSPRLRAAGVAVLVLWAGVNLADHLRLIRATVAQPPLNEHRVLADFLVDQRIRYARAMYWDAYLVDFLSRERVVVTAWDVTRIQDYQRQVDDQGADAWVIERLPCEGGLRVASWCVKR